MRIASVKLTNFRRFEHLEIRDIQPTVKLVVLAGPNGSGKSSLFDAFLLKYKYAAQYERNPDAGYYNKNNEQSTNIDNRVNIVWHGDQLFARGALYVRTAYRNESDFRTMALHRQGPVLERQTLNRLIDHDATASSNYARLASKALEDVFVREDGTKTISEYRGGFVGEIRDPLLRLFPGLCFIGVGNPLEDGTFKFEKGNVKGFDYKNLSGGEKAAFDLILDIVVKRKSYPNAVYCIDEPEAHLNTRIQGALLTELINLMPDESQLWIASHSIGMMKKARELHDADPSAVAFLDFGGHNFDKQTVITPTKPTRAFWNGVLNVALGDLATLVAPRMVVICEGDPNKGKNAEHDAQVYSTIFAEEFPDVTFISAGNADQVSRDWLGLAAALPKIADIKVKRLIDRDDHAAADVADYNKKGITVLGRRHLESYLFDDEVLTKLCASSDRKDAVDNVLAAKRKAISESVQRGNPEDDIKSAAGEIYSKTKSILSLKQAGNDRDAFVRNTLAPLLKPGMSVYETLKNDIFGSCRKIK